MSDYESRLGDAIAAMAEIICPSCREYKGMTTCDDCGIVTCVFCDWEHECDE